MNRRDFLNSSAALATSGMLTGCMPKMVSKPNTQGAPGLAIYDAVPPLAPIRAHEDRLFKITVCLRPFRAQGPRIEAERVGDKLVVHNYGHGGSGWSLSWGSATMAVDLALRGTDATRAEVAVIGCGALGLTSALLAQRAGAKVTIYAKERPPDVRSSRATGSWTPDSRVALTKEMGPAFAARWETMARTSWRAYAGFLGLPGNPVEFIDNYFLSDDVPERALKARREEEPIGFAYLSDRIADLAPHSIDLPPGTHPFPSRYARRNSSLTFNVTDYARVLQEDFLMGGGKIVPAEFHAPAELAALTQPVIINCTGYGARALFGDETIIPVRGQIGWLIPQPEVNYGLYWDRLNIVSRRDGIVVQFSGQGEASGWKDANEEPDRAEANEGVRRLADLFARMKPTRT